MLEHLDSEIQNDPNTVEIILVLLSIIQHVSSIKESQINMYCDLKEDIQKITSYNEDVIMQKVETTMKQLVNFTLAKLGRCMLALDEDNFIEMVERVEGIEVESALCDE